MAVVVAVGLGLLAQPAFALSAQAAAIEVKKAPKITIVDSRPDAVSAMVTARAQGSRVEIESARTENATSWANPNGSISTDVHSGQIRIKNEDGTWRDISLSLTAAADGTVRGKNHARGLKLTGKTKGPTEDFLTVSEGSGREVSLGWSKPLPDPVVEDETATYIGVAPGVDMIIESRRSGFEQTFRLNERPTEAMSWDVQLRTKGLTARPEADGSISFINAEGKVTSVIPPALAWDAVVDRNTGDHVNTSPVAMTVTPKGKNRAVLTITPDPVWLTDPARVAPIFVDPTYASTTLTPSFDTFVQQGVSSDQSSSTDLKLGNNGSGQVARSFLKFPGSIDGMAVISAELKLYENHSWSCSKREWQVWDTGSASSSTRWSDQPTWAAKAAADEDTKGYGSSCAAGWVDQDITALVRDDWANGTGSNTIGLR